MLGIIHFAPVKRPVGQVVIAILFTMGCQVCGQVLG